MLKIIHSYSIVSTVGKKPLSAVAFALIGICPLAPWLYRLNFLSYNPDEPKLAKLTIQLQQ